MVARLGKFIVVSMLVLTTGAHWATLQTVAWTTMLADNLCRHSFSESVVRTFDGKYPCPLCKAIAAGKKSEKKDEFNVPSQKFEFPPAGQGFVLIAPSRFELLPEENVFANSLTQKPLLPPPRALFA